MNLGKKLQTLCSAERGVLLAGILVFATALFWAKASDLFRRIDFSVKTAAGTRIKGIAVLPKSRGPHPTVVYGHSSAGLVGIGNQMRQFAELGMAAVALKYKATNQALFEEELGALSKFSSRQTWSRARATVWVVSGLNVQYALSYVLNHPESRPQLLVCLPGIRVDVSSPPGDQKSEAGRPNFTLPTLISGFRLASELGCKVLLIHDEYDELFPIQEAERLARDFQTNRASLSLKTLRRDSSHLEKDEALIFRLVAESCKSVLAPEEPLVQISRNRTESYWGFVVALLLLTTGLLWVTLRTRFENAKRANVTSTKLQKALRWLAGSLAIFALGETSFRVVIPHLAVNQTTLNVARDYLVRLQEQSDFSYLSSNSVWRGRPLKALLEHIKLAGYNRTLINWKVENEIYDKYVLSPEIDPLRRDCDWRRPLWENFYPRVRKEPDPVSAAQIVVRFLRERVSVVPGNVPSTGIRSDWYAGMTDALGFERIYAAALRSVGVGARLDVSGKVEIWAAGKWIAAPRPPTLD